MLIAGIISVLLFYVIILFVGIWASRKNTSDADQEEEVMLAGRNIGLFVGIFTMTATWVGGGYINGTAEIVYRQGLLWCQAPLGYALSLMLGGIFFARRMRREGYVTMLDPLQETFGCRMGGLLFLPALCGEIFWSAGILAALGATLAIVIDMDLNMAVIFSAFVAVFYTWFGGLYSVAYTDVVQLACIAIGLVLCVPFAWNHEAVKPMTWESQDWIGNIPSGHEGLYTDYMLLLTFGGIPWQVYFQRVLSSKSAGNAEALSYIAAFGCVIMAIPPIMIGAVAKNTNWNETEYSGILPIPEEDHRMILPMVIQFLTPNVVSFFGLGAVSAAVMSSADSSVLSASSMFARNVYKLIFRQKASESEIMWVMRISIFIVGSLATAMALKIPTIYGLWAMCSDLVYVILFPQLLLVVHFKDKCNIYGSLSAYLLGSVIRLTGGEPLIGLPALIYWPLYDKETNTQYFPFRTCAMMLSMITLLGISALFRWLFESGRLSISWDLLKMAPDVQAEQYGMSPLGTAGLTDVSSKKYKSPEEAPLSSPLLCSPPLESNTETVLLTYRKPDPTIRELRRQISFTGSLSISSIKKKISTQSFDKDEMTEDGAVSKKRESFKKLKKELREGVLDVREVAINLSEGASLSSDRPPYVPIENQEP